MPKRSKNPYKPRKSKLKNFVGLVRFLVLLALILIILGFFGFIRSVVNATPASPLPEADGIVVLTGGSDRLEAGASLLKSNKGERMLISGVGRAVPPEDIRKILGVSITDFQCCVDLDSAAKDTIGNARETAIWAKALGYEHIILVTSDYHMPRAKLEISSATGGLRITPYPVATPSNIALWRDGDRLKLLAREYTKLLVIYVSRMGDRPSHPPQPDPAPVDVMKDAQDPPTITGPRSTDELKTPDDIQTEDTP